RPTPTSNIPPTYTPIPASAQTAAHRSASSTPPMRAGFRFTAVGRTGRAATSSARAIDPSKLTGPTAAPGGGSSISTSGSARRARATVAASPEPLKSTTATRASSRQRPRGTEPAAARKAACAAPVQPTCSPRPVAPRPRTHTTDVGRSPPYDGSGTAPTSQSTFSMLSSSAASSGVGGTAEAGEDLAPLRQVPVAEGVADGDRAPR